MTVTDLSGHRHDSEQELIAGLHAGDGLALAEACGRTLPCAHGVARRLVRPSWLESLLSSVYAELWHDPPAGGPLEGWIRGRCFRLAAAQLRARGQAPASPSATLLLPDLPNPAGPTGDGAERLLRALPEAWRAALLWAHDAGVPSAEQDRPAAGAALVDALVRLADPGSAASQAPAAAPAESDLGDWVLGLLPAERAEALQSAAADDAGLQRRARQLLRGRSRLEGPPPPPDLATRLVAWCLSRRPGDDAQPRPATTTRSALDLPRPPVPAAAPRRSAAAPGPARADVTARPAPGRRPAFARTGDLGVAAALGDADVLTVALQSAASGEGGPPRPGSSAREDRDHDPDDRDPAQHGRSDPEHSGADAAGADPQTDPGADHRNGGGQEPRRRLGRLRGRLRR